MVEDEIPLEKGDNTQTTPDYHGTGGPEEQMTRGTHEKKRAETMPTPRIQRLPTTENPPKM